MDTFALSIALDAALADQTPADRVETDQVAAAPLLPAAPGSDLAPAARVVDPFARAGCH